MEKVVYFHGFGGENSEKYTILRDYYAPKGIEVVKFDEAYDFDIDEERFSDLLSTDGLTNVFIIGSSMGSLDTLYFALKHHLSCLVINPSYYPELTLKDTLSLKQHIFVKRIKSEISKLDYDEALINVFISEDDEVLDITQFVKTFKNFLSLKYFKNKGHRFNNMTENLEEIEQIRLREVEGQV